MIVAWQNGAFGSRGAPVAPSFAYRDAGPVAPAPLPLTTNVSPANENPLHPHLAALARSLGIPEVAKHYALVVRHGDIDTTISVETHKGVVCGLSIVCNIGALPDVVLEAEGNMDVAGKRLGINRELQTGDTAFDDAVYIESDAPDEAISTLLSRPETRAAVRHVLSLGYGAIAFGTFGVSAKRVTAEGTFEPESFRRALSAVVGLAQQVPRIGHGEDRPGGVVQAMVMGASLLFAFLAMMFRAKNVPTSASSLSMALLGWLPLVLLYIALFRGRSTSLRHLVVTSIATLLTLLLVCARVMNAVR